VLSADYKPHNITTNTKTVLSAECTNNQLQFTVIYSHQQTPVDDHGGLDDMQYTGASEQSTAYIQ